MKMRLEHVFYTRTTGIRAVDIRLDFAQGIDNRHLAVTFNIISALSQASGINLFNFHIRVIEAPKI